MKTKQPPIKAFYIAFLACCGVLLAVAAFYDLKLDQLLNSPENPFGKFLERTGELPVYLVIPFASMIFFNTRSKSKTAKNIFYAIAVAVFNLFGCILFCIQMGDNWLIKDDYRQLYEIIFGIIFSALSLYISTKLPYKTMKKLRPYASFIMIAALGTAVTVELIKNLWGRVRFRDLLKQNDDFAQFTRWFLPQGKTGNKSFPSGHTSAASSVLLLSALPVIFKKLKKYEVRIFLLCLAYTFAVGLSRMIVGAHYLSDITMGAMIGFLWFLFTKKFYLERNVTE